VLPSLREGSWCTCVSIERWKLKPIPSHSGQWPRTKLGVGLRQLIAILSFRLLVLAGFDPIAALGDWENNGALATPESIHSSYLDSHPRSDDRIHHLRRETARIMADCDIVKNQDVRSTQCPFRVRKFAGSPNHVRDFASPLPGPLPPDLISWVTCFEPALVYKQLWGRHYSSNLNSHYNSDIHHDPGQ